MWPIGVLFALGGVWIMLQSRVPLEKRKVRAGRGGRGPILDKRQCIRMGGIFAIAGLAVALQGIGVKIATPHVLVAVACGAALIYFSANVRD